MISVRKFFVISLLLVLSVSSARSAEPLRYKLTKNQRFSYQVDVIADLPDKVETLSGIISFTATSTTDPLGVAYRGGLKKSTKKKPGASSGGGGFDPFGGLPVDPFARPRNPFKGLETTTNKVSLTSAGKILAIEGSSQLPYLLGNLSLMAFEPLAGSEKGSWKVDSGVTISEGGGNDPTGPGAFFDPFAARSNRPEKTSAGGESTSFTFRSDRAGIRSYTKTYRLHSPGDKESITVTGQGTWAFNSELGVSESLSFNQKIVVEEGNTTFTIPVSIKYRRMSEAAVAKLEAERAVAIAKAKEDHEKRMAAAAEAKRIAEAPLEPQQKQRLLASLKSRNPNQVVAALAELQRKSPKDPDAEIVAAIRPFTTNSDPKVKDAATKALAKWSTDFRTRQELNRAYRGPSPVRNLEHHGPQVEANTRLLVGQIVVARSSGSWYAGEIKELLPGDQVKMTFNGWGSKLYTRDRKDIHLAHPVVDQPNLSAADLASTSASSAVPTPAPSTKRTWTSSNGKYKIDAEFLRVSNGSVVLKRTKDGREITVPLAKLSAADQSAAQRLAKAAEDDENPFEP